MGAVLCNISLDDKLGTHLAVEQRFRMVMAAMRICFREVAGEIAAATYDGPDGKVHEHCAVVTISCDAPRNVFEDGLHHIAHSMGQDCIAVLYPDGSGKCVGPNAHRWPFDIKFFNRPAVYQALAAA